MTTNTTAISTTTLSTTASTDSAFTKGKRCLSHHTLLCVVKPTSSTIQQQAICLQDSTSFMFKLHHFSSTTSFVYNAERYLSIILDDKLI